MSTVKTIVDVLGPFARWPTVYWFALEMVRKLDSNKPKKGGREGWENDDPLALLGRLREEVEELSAARNDIGEAADVANMAMMVADSIGLLRSDAPSALGSCVSTSKIVCGTCGTAEASCFGSYEGHERPNFSCDTCCGHGNEDGWCEPLPTTQWGEP